MDFRLSKLTETAYAPGYGVTEIRGMKPGVPRILTDPSVRNSPIYARTPSYLSSTGSIDAALMDIDHLLPSESDRGDWSRTIFLVHEISIAPCGIHLQLSGVMKSPSSSGGMMQK